MFYFPYSSNFRNTGGTSITEEPDPNSADPYLYYDNTTERVVSTKPLETTLNSYYLGKNHKISSGAANIYFTDLTTRVNYYPCWGGLKDQSVAENQTTDGCIKPYARIFHDYNNIGLGGNPVNGTSIPYDGDNYFSFNISGMGITTVSAENVNRGDRLLYCLDVDGIAVYEQFLTETTISNPSPSPDYWIEIDQPINWVFDHPLDIQAGSTNHASIFRIDADGNKIALFNVNQGDALVNGAPRYQTTVNHRLFDNEELALKSQVGTDVYDAMDETLNFQLDATSTSVLVSNGEHYGVNSIKAINDNGIIKIISFDDTGKELIVNLDNTNVLINGNAPTGGIDDIVNKLNELFTVGAFTSVVINDPFSTDLADVGGTEITYTLEGNNAINPIGDAILASSSANYNGACLLSVDTISKPNEYYSFDIQNRSIIGMGLVHTQASYDAGLYSGNSTYANPTTFGNGTNSGHYGFQFSHWFHPTNIAWTNYGANTSYSMREGWSSTTKGIKNSEEGANLTAGNPIKMRVGLSANGYIHIDYYDVSASEWIMVARTTYSQQEGSSFRLGLKLADTYGRIYSVPKVHLVPVVAPSMYFRYIEAFDNTFHYPLFNSMEEVEYYNTTEGHTATDWVRVVYQDDPTFYLWYKPLNGFTDDATAIPDSSITFDGHPITWTEITSLTDAQLAPSAYTSNTITVDEFSAVNIAVSPADAGYTTSITDNDNSGLTLIGSNIEGSAPEVSGDNVSNPSDTYTITITRTNPYGSSTGVLTIIVNNLTAPVVAISGFNHVSGTTPLIDSNTLASGSVVHVNNTVADGERFVISKSYVETNILPSLQASGDKYIIGLENTNADFTTVDLTDFDCAIVWEYESPSSHTFKFYRDGNLYQNIVVASNVSAFYDYAIEITGTSAWLIACNLNSIMNEPSPSNGGSFSNTYEVANIADTPPVVIHMAYIGSASADISTTSLTTLTTPSPPPSITTNYNKALDFSGSSEYVRQVSVNVGDVPLRMDREARTVPGHATPGYTSNDFYSRPWATCIVFKIDGHNSNQHIWNYGEGASSGDDNIYVRLDATGHLYFGWGREGAGYNECAITDVDLYQPIASNSWYSLYIAHTGERLSGTDATPTNLAGCFDIRLIAEYNSRYSSYLFNFNQTHGAPSPNRSTAGPFDAHGWNTSSSSSSGVRMDRQFDGVLTIGGRSSNRSFHGKVASFVSTTLKCGVPMPDNTEIEMLMTNPVAWFHTYLEGNAGRPPDNKNNYVTYALNDLASAKATQIWLMGDGSADNYSNGVRNYIYPTEQNSSKLTWNSMVSSDIETVNIAGLT